MNRMCFRVAIATLTVLVLLGLLPSPSASQSSDFIVPTRPLPQGRAFHGSAVMGDHLYVFGGRISPDGTRESEENTNSSLVAPISSDGHVGTWRPTTPLPGPRFYIANSTLVMNDVVYIVGGSTAPTGGELINTAIWSRPLPNGNLTAWQQSAPFGTAVSTPAAVTTPGHLHLLGGFRRAQGGEGQAVSREVWTNQIYADGSLGRWERGPDLPLPLWYHHSGVVAGRVYVWGGLAVPQSQGIDPVPYMISAPILSSGRLGPWQREQTDLPKGFHGAPSAVAGNFLMSFVPRTARGAVDDAVYYTQVAPGGRVARWGSHTSNIPNKRFHAAAADYRRGAIYITGGRGTSQDSPALAASSFFTLSGSARQQAEQAWLAAVTAHTNSVSAAPSGAQTGGTLTYIADRQLQAGAVQGFRTVSEARNHATSQRRPLVMYFQIPEAAPCIEQKEKLETPEFARLTEVASFAWIDSTEYPQLVQQMAVYRVPTWVFYDPNGMERFRHIGVLDAGQIAEALSRMVTQRGG